MKKFYLVISFTFLLISCNEFNTLNKKKISKTKSNINLDKTINLNKGIYYCKKCNSKLYSSTNKLDSNDNNESFYKSIENNVEYDVDYRANNNKTELIENCKVNNRYKKCCKK